MKKIKSYLLFNLVVVWLFSGLTTVRAQNESGPKNIIFMIGDGMGFNHVLSGDYYQYGEEGKQVYEGFPVKLASTTYPAEGSYDTELAWGDMEYFFKYYTDSAAGATALSTAVKTHNGSIGVDTAGVRVMNILERGNKLGKSTGVVTSVPFTHATPAGFVAHNKSRHNYHQLSVGMLLESGATVIMGAGHPEYGESGEKLDEPVYKYIAGEEMFEGIRDGDTEFTVDDTEYVVTDIDGDEVSDPWTYIEDPEDFRTMSEGETPKRVFGLAKIAATLQANREGEKNTDPFSVPFVESVPTLAEMTLAALNVLDNNEKGLFLMVEGGAIDWAAHGNDAGRVIEEQIDFNRAVEAVVYWIENKSSWDETLLIVTADHETGYLLGPGAEDGNFPAVINNGKGVLPGLEFYSDNHTNNLVPVYAKGKGAEMLIKFADKSDPVRGSYLDNTEIAKVMHELWSN